MLDRRLAPFLCLPFALCAPFAAAPAVAQPSETTLTVVPAAPTEDDFVSVVVESLWPDGCTPGFTRLEVELDPTGNLRRRVTLTGGIGPGGGGCPAVVTHFRLEAPVGRLEPGTHEVVVEGGSFDNPDFLAEFGTVTFTVAGEAPEALLLDGGRFKVEVAWKDFAGGQGVGRVVPGATVESGLFWFFGRDNWELLVKVLDACSFNGRFWVLGAAATNVEYTVEVQETATGEVWSFTNPLGNRSPAFLDTDAFECPPDK